MRETTYPPNLDIIIYDILVRFNLPTHPPKLGHKSYLIWFLEPQIQHKI